MTRAFLALAAVLIGLATLPGCSLAEVRSAIAPRPSVPGGFDTADDVAMPLLIDVAKTLPESSPFDTQQAKLGHLVVTSTLSTGIAGDLPLERREGLLGVSVPETPSWCLFPLDPGTTRYYVHNTVENSGESSVTLPSANIKPLPVKANGKQYFPVGNSQIETRTTPLDYENPHRESFELGPGGVIDWIYGVDIPSENRSLAIYWAFGPVGTARFTHPIPR